MTRRPMVLRPQDVAVALQLVLTPDLPIARVAREVRLSQGEVHNAEQRLRAARLVRRHHRYAERRALLEFILHGVPYVFPGEPGWRRSTRARSSCRSTTRTSTSG